jgi:hypothetical protein
VIFGERFWDFFASKGLRLVVMGGSHRQMGNISLKKNCAYYAKPPTAKYLSNQY